MFVTPAYAQTSGGAGGGLEAILPLVLIFVVFYFLLIRPQQKKMKQHKETLAAIRRGDRVVTGGGIMGLVAKVDDEEQVTVEIATDVKVKVRRELISAVISKPQPVSNSMPNKNEATKSSGGFLSGIFGESSKKNAKVNVPEKNESSIRETEKKRKKKEKE